MRSFMMLVAATLACPVTAAALAQTPLQQQQIVAPTDICEDDEEDAGSCAQHSMERDNWPAFVKWAQRAARQGDYIVAYWLAGKYESGEREHAPGWGGIEKDSMRAYIWYDIAAQLHARYIQTLPATSDNLRGPETNKAEILARDYVAKNLSDDRIAEALLLEKEWFATHKPVRPPLTDEERLHGAPERHVKW